MNRSPYDLSEDLKETLCQYLETAHEISHPAIARERAELLRSDGTVSQRPYVETTPRFRAGSWLRDVDLPQLPEGFPEFVGHGLSTEKFPLYAHQEAALRAAWREDGTPGSLVVASGTGSGKTECFYLPILADILREAREWSPPRGDEKPGEWRPRRGVWEHGRRHETRPAAMRAVVLYPMNALVNDQLRRLRQTLDSEESLRWQRRNLGGNVIRFGRYTGQAELPGSPTEDFRRKRWREYTAAIRSGWESVGEELRSSGGWPRPDGAEMLGRWDMQAAPPDILVTNYSMLEYMLLRPEEAAMFEETRRWLASSEENVVTLVLDEAHSYSGTQGTEVAYLIRRLFERLGAGPEQVRCIATSATLGNTAEDVVRVRHFASELFGQSAERFSVIQSETVEPSTDLPSPTREEITAFATFQEILSMSDTTDEQALREACSTLADSLRRESVGEEPSRMLFEVLGDHPRLLDVRDRTARRARDIGLLADEVWGTLGDGETRNRATAGLLAAGALAREKPDDSTPPLLPSRLHLMFRGVSGIWACVDPECPAAPQPREGRPCGKLYAEPRVWCECSARVLELFHCRTCGLLFLGGLPDSEGRLWPYEDDLESGFQDYDRYQVFAAEDPNVAAAKTKGWAEERRLVSTTGAASFTDEGARSLWTDPDKARYGRVPTHCPRCDARGNVLRKTVQAMRSTGPQALRVLTEQAFRNQPPRTAPASVAEEPRGDTNGKSKWKFKSAKKTVPAGSVTENPNRGRKALVFSDGRQEAATLAVNLTQLHMRDLFRQLLLVVIEKDVREAGLRDLSVPRLRERVMDLALSRGIDPTLGEDDSFWGTYATSSYEARSKAAPLLEAYLRREVADRQVGVENLGLARWVLDFEGEVAEEVVPPLEPFDARETVTLLHAVLRILSGYDVLLPGTGDPEDWPHELVPVQNRRLIVRQKNPDSNTFTWSAERDNRLTRYLRRVCEAAGTEDLASFMERLWDEYLVGPEIVQNAQGVRSGWGVPLNGLAIAPVPERMHRCLACGYLNADAVRSVCVRCGGGCRETALSSVVERNYYRRVASLVLAGDGGFDPFPLRALEHTAQISATKAASRERHFQDRFIPDGAEREDAKQHRVDILSVTTTMEMGIDIGDLTSVGLNGTPPTVANYQQRAGRAGRRSDSTATVITFARDHSHDQYYYSRVADIVTGRVRVPQVHLRNASIARRHLNSLVLQRFFTESRRRGDGENLLGAFGSIGDFLKNPSGGRRELKKRLSEGSFRESVRASALVALEGWEAEVDGWLDALPEAVNGALDGKGENENLLETLVTSGVLPRYAFPVDVVALWPREPSKYNRGDEVQRDLQIALSEYAPDSEIVIDGWLYRSAGLYTPYERDPHYKPDVWLGECPNCHHMTVRRYSAQGGASERCPMCGEDPGGRSKEVPAIRPLGFRTDWSGKISRYRGGLRARSGSSSSAQLNAGETADQGTVRLSGRLWVNERVGELYSVNYGTDGGFRICPSCGRSLRPGQSSHRRPEGKPARNCPGRPEGSTALYHSFQSNVVVLGVDLPDGLDADPTEPGGRSAWLSVSAAMTRAASSYLQINSSELASGIRPWRDPKGRLQAEVFVYDTLPNGAGYAGEIAENVEEILKRARGLSSGCPESCESACYSCLLDYGNQRQHGLIDRRLAADLLDYVIDGRSPELSSERQIRALTRLRGFAPDGSFELDEKTGTAYVRTAKREIEVRCAHSLASRVPADSVVVNASVSEMRVRRTFSEFDLQRRPFWIWNGL